jgi:hypothetical protein
MNNLMHGKGCFIFPEHHPSQIDFVVADFNLDVATGKGYVQYANGDIYEGEILRFDKHGKGSYYNHVTGQTISSNWVNGVQKQDN